MFFSNDESIELFIYLTSKLQCNPTFASLLPERGLVLQKQKYLYTILQNSLLSNCRVFLLLLFKYIYIS